MQVLTEVFLHNEVFITFVGSLIALAICIAIGYTGRKTGILTDPLNAGMSSVMIKITLPCTIFVSMMRPFTSELLLESLATLFITAVVFLFGYVVGMALARIMRISDGEKRVWQFALVFPNVAYMGFPVIQALYGHYGMVYTAMANVSFQVLAFSLGVYLFNKKSDSDVKANLRAIAYNPALIVTGIAFIFFVTGFRLPAPIFEGVRLVGDMTVPLSMLLVGSILAKSRVIELVSDPKVLPVVFMRLVGIPLITFSILRLFIHNPVMLGVIVVLSAMPAAALTVIFAEQYKGDTAVASRLVAISSFLCLFTIPLISLLL